MKETPQKTKRLSDYRAPDWLVPETNLVLELDPARTIVKTRLRVRRNGQHRRPLVLDGDGLELLGLKVDGIEQPLPNDSSTGLAIELPGDEADIETTVAIRPDENSKLMGLYQSNRLLVTQCEAEGFRRITYFPDRPDVLSHYRVRLEGDRRAFPVLLSNGNCVAEGDLPAGRHFAQWEDPHPKPCYLFAAVAGPMAALSDHFRTQSGRDVALFIWVDGEDVDRCRHAMDSLKAAMRFDETEYGREYDLDRFNIVAVRDFNFGAMENKSLNIFNSKYIMADENTATDADFDAIAGVVAHEYFHNWSGNRVTCRDWFQLCLKEGFTVFRDQSFSASQTSAALKRIETARTLRSQQFPEDDGPLAHPVRPEAYQEISNFYTSTIYEKGAELIRMIKGMLGAERFRRATDRYFADNDGRAATIEDFLAAMEKEGLDAARFHRWYEQPGTPRLSTELLYRPEKKEAELILAQTNPKVKNGAPLLIPLDIALFDPDDGRKIFELRDAALDVGEMRVLVEHVERRPVPSVNRGFRAPVITVPRLAAEQLLLLARHEDDPFQRYEAIQQLMQQAVMRAIATGDDAGTANVTGVVGDLLSGWESDPALTAEALLPPSEAILGDQMAKVDPEALHRERLALLRAIASAHGQKMWAIYRGLATDPHDRSPRAKGLRRLKAVLLSCLMALQTGEAAAAALRQFDEAQTMTDRMAAFVALSHADGPERDAAIAHFYERFRDFPDVLDKWFLVQAQSTREDTRATVEKLLHHKDFSHRNPNRLRSLLVGFGGNQTRLHDRDGKGYRLLADETLLVDCLNPQSAARLVQPLTRWRRLAEPWGERMKQELERIGQADNLSLDLSEVVENSLN